MGDVGSKLLSSREEVIASFDFFDFSTGIGYKKFYAVGLVNNTGNEYILAGTLLESDSFNTGTGNLGTGSSEINWDVSFNKLLTIAKSEAIIRIKSNSTGAGKTHSFLFTLYHVDKDNNETSIGAVTSRTIDGSYSDNTTIKLITSRKVIRIGEKLRLSVLFTRSGSFSGYAWDASIPESIFSILLPFEVKK